MNICQFVKKFDLFSQPFAFFIDKSSKKKKTVLGGILSAFIIIISTCYFIYLLFLYFSNKFLPKITTSQYNELNQQTMVLEESLFAFQVFTNGKALEQIEQETGKKYLSYNLYHSILSISSEAKYIRIPLKQCEENSIYSGYICMNLEVLPLEAKTLKQYPNGPEVGNYEFIVSECTDLLNCATQQEIEDVILSVNTNFFIKTSIKQYNQTTQQFQTSFKLDYYSFDNDLAMTSTFSMKKSYTSVDQGLFLQETVKTDHLVNFNKIDRYFSKRNMLTKIGFEGFFSFSFQLDQICEISHIQFPMITEILSQFMSIFNILLTIGILAQIFSESRIIEDVSSIYLKEYYKNTAIKLIYNEQKHILENKDQNFSGNSIILLQKEINDFDFVEKQKDTFKISFGQRLKMLVFGIFNKIEKKTSKEQQIYQKMISQTVERIDIQEVYKDLIKLKMAIKLMLTKEQYVALQFCGCELNLECNTINQGEILKSQQKEVSQNIKTEQIIPSSYIVNQDLSQFQENNISLQIKNQQNSIINPIDEEQQNDKLNIQYEYFGCTLQQSPDQRIKKLTSCENKFQEENDVQKNQLSQNQLENYQNHLNEIDELVSDQMQLQKYLDNFIQKFNDKNKQKSLIDQNIYNSLICHKQLKNHNLQL